MINFKFRQVGTAFVQVDLEVDNTKIDLNLFTFKQLADLKYELESIIDDINKYLPEQKNG
jgi:hypothetical protein